MNNNAPRWPLKLLERFCAPELFDEISGDLLEYYHLWVGRYGVAKARRLYVWHTLKFLRPFILKSKPHPVRFNAMARTYLTMSWRNIIRHKAISAINVLGLALSLTCVIYIFNVINHHLHFDNFHRDADRIFKINTRYISDTNDLFEGAPQPLGKAFRTMFSFAEKTARMRKYNSVMIYLPEEPGDKRFHEEEKTALVEPEYFNIFNFPLLHGKLPQLTSSNQAVITESMAIKYFSTDNATGKLIRVAVGDVNVDYVITGILKDLPTNTYQKCQIFLSYDNLKDYNAYYASDDSWGSVSSNMHCYVKLVPGVKAAEVNAAFPKLVNQYYSKEEAKQYAFELQPLADIHFNTELGGDFSKKYLWSLGLVGIFLIAIAAVNFVNLSSSQIIQRSKEVGIRKVLGSMRSSIFMQFIVETSIIAASALALAFGMTQLMTPFANALLGEALAPGHVDYAAVLEFLAVILIVIIVIAGVYPAVLMTRFAPAQVLKTNYSSVTAVGGFSLRRVLIVCQFVVSQVLMVCMMVVDNQIRFAQSTDLGFDKSATLTVPLPTPDIARMKAFNARVASIPGVNFTTLCYDAPASQGNNFTGVRLDLRPADELWEVNLKDCDDQYASTFALQIVAGRNILPTDSVRDFLVNEILVRKWGLSSNEDAIGRQIAVNGNTVRGVVAGVVRNFNNTTMHEPIPPICMMINYDRFRKLGIKLDLRHSKEALTSIEKVWRETYPQHVYTYAFVDDTVRRFYELDNIMLSLVQIFSAVAIAVSCLGLFGLVSFMAIRKTREISIRKVLGADLTTILWLFAQEFMTLILIAFVISSPLAIFIMNNWLDSFAYKLPLGASSFVVTILITLMVSGLTVGYHAVRAGLSNPVDNLKVE